MSFSVTLIDMRDHSKILDHFLISALSRQEATRLACKILKHRSVWKDHDVQQLIEIIELGDEFNCAGHEFDVLPEALRRLRLEVSPMHFS